ncbi:hypothetical protein SODALDRAFT_358812 [Sodiomyces alkalinus F11]|uniref:Uncharacterized protein n=1 Tax=Sodiomyces alkalinus (strain CBS 110278 / VKM F-3762 / F11) TaxID=1314773 RepID=A0A3N2PXA5_SODAK|nr:hypothetical protein SODALDRAFT_358812 [Sodiomyces alkalinus F11]ROT38975.1 hypothetical protein SODALDRAFT_358812 [Sodiomyces alkalinus F11]
MAHREANTMGRWVRRRPVVGWERADLSGRIEGDFLKGATDSGPTVEERERKRGEYEQRGVAAKRKYRGERDEDHVRQQSSYLLRLDSTLYFVANADELEDNCRGWMQPEEVAMQIANLIRATSQAKREPPIQQSEERSETSRGEFEAGKLCASSGPSSPSSSKERKERRVGEQVEAQQKPAPAESEAERKDDDAPLTVVSWIVGGIDNGRRLRPPKTNIFEDSRFEPIMANVGNYVFRDSHFVSRIRTLELIEVTLLGNRSFVPPRPILEKFFVAKSCMSTQLITVRTTSTYEGR